MALAAGLGHTGVATALAAGFGHTHVTMVLAAGLGDTGIAIVAAVSLAAGYGVLWALWHFVFSPRHDHDDSRGRGS